MATGLIGRPTFGGLASGLDTNALLSGLLEIERIPLNRIQSRRSEIANQRSLMRDLNTKLVALREAAQNLDNRNSAGSGASATEEFLKYSGSSTNEDIVTVSAGAGAAPGDIEIEIRELARGARRFSTQFADPGDTALAAGQSLSIELADGDDTADPEEPPTRIDISVDTGEGDLSLQDIRDQINTNEGNGGKVRADIIRFGEDNYQLVLTTTGTGLSNTMTVLGDLAFQDEVPERDAPRNAEIRLFGIDTPIYSETNAVEDALTGVTFDLRRVSEESETTPGELLSETVTIEVDNDEIAEGLEAFTKAYNEVVDFIDNQFRYDENRKTAGPLAGDFTLRQVQSELRDMVSSGFKFSTNPSNPFAPSVDGGLGGAITNIGITIESGGRLSVDREKLDEALALDPISVREFLSGRARADGDPDPNSPTGDDIPPDLFDEGFATLFSTELERLVQSGDGTLAERDKSYERRLRDFDASIERFEARLSQREESLVLRFSELERIVAGLQNQQGFLSSIPS